eukprot:TRINITY_DN4922_c0_g1_i1.p1 TRINITY_DN4922_c0_g1~~TRINITY_DN4922_c0_g1_i1.p1  ORF type:complete len:102 (-),score=15.57 TRINITY_DN4922_c0_g1_i1:31-336(-)
MSEDSISHAASTIQKLIELQTELSQSCISSYMNANLLNTLGLVNLKDVHGIVVLWFTTQWWRSQLNLDTRPITTKGDEYAFSAKLSKPQSNSLFMGSLEQV